MKNGPQGCESEFELMDGQEIIDDGEVVNEA